MSGFTDDLRAGLAARPRRVPPKWFYDFRGSQLFDRICELPEYYPTRTELALLERHAADIARQIGPGAEIVEWGAGAARKVRLLLGALQAPVGYVPVDISGDYLLAAAAALRAELPGLAIRPLVADFTRALVLPPRLGPGPRVGFYPGSSIGNFEPAQAAALLRQWRLELDEGGLLIGVDLVKDPQLLHAAYNDAEGVTAEFNLNLWARANREAGADFRLDQWLHCAFYNPTLQRIEMHLVSRCPQRVTVGGQAFDFDEGDSVHTESSYKYTVPGFQRLAHAAGWSPAGVWVDPGRQVALHWLQAPGRAGPTAAAALPA